jgi:hypothetical protein
MDGNSAQLDRPKGPTAAVEFGAEEHYKRYFMRLELFTNEHGP